MLRCLSFIFCVFAVTEKSVWTHILLHMRFTHYTYYYMYGMFSDLPLQGLNIRQVIYYSVMLVSKINSV